MRFLMINLLLLSAACTYSPAQPDTSLTLEIVVTKPDRIRFYGKGVGAGMLMSTSLGPMGVAIGVAIDEGTGKEIEETANTLNFNIVTIVEDTLRKEWASKIRNEKKFITINIQRYGFVTRSGKNDPVAAQLHILAKSGDGPPKEYRYPEDYESSPIITGPLDHIKMEPLVIHQLFGQAAVFLAAEVLE